MLSDAVLAKFKTEPGKHQILGVEKILQHPAFALFDEMGVGKSKQSIDAACLLHYNSEIDAVVVLAPSPVRSSWLNPEFGEIQKHCWAPWVSYEYHAKGLRKIGESQAAPPRLAWVVTNYEFLRRKIHLDKLIYVLRNRKAMIVLDEGIFIKNPKAAQTKAAYLVRQACRRAVLLNGTPVGNNPLDLYSQMKVLDKNIIPSPNIWAFRNRYCRMGGYMNKQIIGYQNIEELQRLIAPYVLRRKKEDCLDLPQKLYSVLDVRMAEKSWRMYKEMRDDMVTWLDGQTFSLAAQAVVKMIRLSQLTSGLLGGTGDDKSAPPVVVGSEKLDMFVEWLKCRLEEDENFRVVVWCRFRYEQELIAQAIKSLIPVYRIYGGQNREERELAIREFSVGQNTPGALLGQQQAGGYGLNLVTARNVVYMSNDYSLTTRLQTEDRTHRTGQHFNVNYFDVLASGPDGQKTIDHAIVRALRKKEDIANWTTDAWRQALLEE
jgi:SNF2 family DNA or RNA helicase